jgi:hypothetical protein
MVAPRTPCCPPAVGISTTDVAAKAYALRGLHLGVLLLPLLLDPHTHFSLSPRPEAAAKKQAGSTSADLSSLYVDLCDVAVEKNVLEANVLPRWWIQVPWK